MLQGVIPMSLEKTCYICCFFMLHPYQQQVDKSGGNFSTEGETSTLVSLHLSTRLILSNEGKRAVEQGN